VNLKRTGTQTERTLPDRPMLWRGRVVKGIKVSGVRCDDCGNTQVLRLPLNYMDEVKT
jgi:hypothetical protein